MKRSLGIGSKASHGSAPDFPYGRDRTVQGRNHFGVEIEERQKRKMERVPKGSHPFQTMGAPAPFNQGLLSKNRLSGQRIAQRGSHQQARNVAKLPVKVLTREDAIAAAMKKQQEQLGRSPKQETMEEKKPVVSLVESKEEIGYNGIRKPKIEVEEETKPVAALSTGETKPKAALTTPVSHGAAVNGMLRTPPHPFTARTFGPPGSKRNQNPSAAFKKSPPRLRKVILAPPPGLVRPPHVGHQRNQVAFVEAPVNGIAKGIMRSTGEPIENEASSSAPVSTKCSFGFRANGNFRMSSNPVRTSNYHNRFPIPQTGSFFENDFVIIKEETEKTRCTIYDDQKCIAFNPFRYIIKKNSDPSNPSKPVKITLEDRQMFSEEYLRKLFIENPKIFEFDCGDGTIFDASDVIECHLCRYVMRLYKSKRRESIPPAYRCLRRNRHTTRSIRSVFCEKMKRQPYGKRKPKNDGPEKAESEDKSTKPKIRRPDRSTHSNSGTAEDQPIEDSKKNEYEEQRGVSSDQDEDFVEYEDPFDGTDEEYFQKRLDSV